MYNGIALDHKKFEIMPSAATCMDLEMVILCRVRQWKADILWYHFMWNLKGEKKRYRSTPMQNKNRLTAFENKLMVTKGDRWGRAGLWVGYWHMHTEVFGVIGQQGPVIQNRELYPSLCDDLCGKRVWKRTDIYTCLSEPLSCTAETITFVNPLQ